MRWKTKKPIDELYSTDAPKFALLNHIWDRRLQGDRNPGDNWVGLQLCDQQGCWQFIPKVLFRKQ